MFLKVKLDPKRQRSDGQKKASYFEIHKEDCILHMKQHIAKIIDIPAESQVVKTLTHVYTDTQSIGDFLRDSENGRGTALLLCRAQDNNSNAEPEFVCFLQFYNDQEAAEQQQLEVKSKEPNFFNKIPKDSAISLITSSESEADTQDDSSTTSSSRDSASNDSSSSYSSGGAGGKRKLSHAQESSQKHKSIRLSDRLSSRGKLQIVRSYLEEFPKYPPNAQSTPLETSKAVAAQNDNWHNSSEGRKSLNTNVPESSNVTPPLEETLTNANSSASTQLVQVNATSSTTIERNPWAKILPEKRQHMIVVSSDCGSLNRTDFEEILNSVFQQSNVPVQLQYVGKSAVNLFDGKLWIACENATSEEWTLENVRKVPRSYKVENYRAHMNGNGHQLHECNVVVPVCKSRKSASDMFALLEKQNVELCTERWMVVKRRAIATETDEYVERCVSNLCSHEVLFLFVDEASSLYLQEQDYELKYCFWKIVFEMKK